MTVAVILALCLLILTVACAVRYAGRYCCCLAPRGGSYTPSPSPTTKSHSYTDSKPVMTNQRQHRRVERPREVERTVVQSTAQRRAAQLAKTEPTYRSIVMIGGSDRPVRRAVPSKDPTRPQWTVRQKTGSSWGNLSLVTNDTTSLPPPPPPPPAPLPSKTIVLGRRDDQNHTGRRTVPAIVNLLEGRLEGTAEIHDSQLILSVPNDTK